MSEPTAAELDLLSRQVRFRLIEISHRAQTAHLAGALSCVDLLVALYWTRLRISPGSVTDPGRDRLIFSKGHAVSALYTVLAMRDFFPIDNLARYNEEGAGLPEQPSPGCVPGVEWATGSLGHGLGVGIGMAVASRIQSIPYRTFVVMSDGECQEGSVWEAAMLAPRLGLLRSLLHFSVEQPDFDEIVNTQQYLHEIKRLGDEILGSGFQGARFVIRLGSLHEHREITFSFDGL